MLGSQGDGRAEARAVRPPPAEAQALPSRLDERGADHEQARVVSVGLSVLLLGVPSLPDVYTRLPSKPAPTAMRGPLSPGLVGTQWTERHGVRDHGDPCLRTSRLGLSPVGIEGAVFPV